VSKPYKVEPSSRQVIENKLLTGLQEEGNVATLFGEEDLRVMIVGLSMVFYAAKGTQPAKRRARAGELLAALQLLRKSAFKKP